MNCAITDLELTVAAGLGFIFIFVALWVNQTAIPRDDIQGFKQAGLALQLSGTKETVSKIVGEENSPDRLKLRTGISRDFVFIFAYTGFFVAVGLLLSQAKTSGARWFGFSAAVFIIGAAAFDLLENYRIIEILSLPLSSISDVLCHKLRLVSSLKWLLFFLGVGFESIVLIKLFNLFSIIGVLLIVSAVAGLFAIYFTRLFPWAFGTLSLGVILLTISLIALNEKLLRSFC